MDLFSDDARFIADVLDWLNQAPRDASARNYVKVQLMSEDHRVEGTFTDEIGPDSWYLMFEKTS